MPSWHGWRRQWQPTPVLLPGKSHGQRSLVGCSPWGRKESDTTKRLHFHFALSCVGEGNDNPLQCSCLENPRDGRAWWAAVYGVAQSRTRLKRLSSSSSSSRHGYSFLQPAISGDQDRGDLDAVCSTSVIPCRAWLCRLTFAQPAAARRVSRFWKVLSLALEPVAVCRVCG